MHNKSDFREVKQLVEGHVASNQVLVFKYRSIFSNGKKEDLMLIDFY